MHGHPDKEHLAGEQFEVLHVHDGSGKKSIYSNYVVGNIHHYFIISKNIISKNDILYWYL